LLKKGKNPKKGKRKIELRKLFKSGLGAENTSERSECPYVPYVRADHHLMEYIEYYSNINPDIQIISI